MQGIPYVYWNAQWFNLYTEAASLDMVRKPGQPQKSQRCFKNVVSCIPTLVASDSFGQGGPGRNLYF